MKRSQQHTIDFLFPIALFFAFSATALVVLLLAANIYKNIVTDSDSGFTQTTALSYICEKIRQNDEQSSASISLTTFDGCDALALTQHYNEHSYTTYIYEDSGALKELFIRSDAEATAASGTSILKIKKLKMDELTCGTYKFTCTSEDGSSDSVIISTRSHQAEH